MADGLAPGTLALPGIDDLRLIGRGGTATLYRGRQAAFNRDVAVKVLDAIDDRVDARFSKELRAIGSLSGHRHVVPVYEAGELHGHPYLVMPYLAGGSLADRMRSGPVAPSEARRIGLAVADALAAAHELGLLHRDVKPANVLFNSYGEAQLADFGIARFADATQTQGLITATIGYAAPEVLAGEPASPAADVYSLGATLHAALRGAPPYVARPEEAPIAFAVRVMQGDPPVLEGVPAGLAAVVARAMRRDPAGRFPDAATMGAALAGADFTPPAPVPPTARFARPAPAAPVRTPRNRNRRAVAAGAVLLAAVGAVIAVLALVSSGAPSPRPAPARVGAPAAAPTTRPGTTAATTIPPAAPATTARSSAAPVQSPATTAPPATPGSAGPAAVGTYVRNYYSLVSAHSLSQSWTWLSPAYQQRLGYGYYQQFWNSVRTVDILGVTPASSQATVDIRYDMTDGTTQTERALLSFVTAGGRRLIDNTQVIG